MRDIENETAAIFEAVVDIYQSDFDLYRSSHSNKGSFQKTTNTVLFIALYKFSIWKRYQLKICSEVVSRNISLQNSQNVSKKTSKKIERIRRQNDIVRGFQNLIEVSIILENQLNTDTSGLIPTVCRDRFDHVESSDDHILDIFHVSERTIFTESNDEVFDRSYDESSRLKELVVLLGYYMLNEPKRHWTRTSF